MVVRVLALACALVVAAFAAGPVHARTIGQAIDDTAIVAQVRPSSPPISSRTSYASRWDRPTVW